MDLQFLVGVPLLLAPGAALVWAYVPGLDVPKFIVAAVILSLTVPPAILLLLNVFLSVPVTAMNVVLVWLLVAWTPLAGRVSRLLEDRA